MFCLPKVDVAALEALLAKNGGVLGSGSSAVTMETLMLEAQVRYRSFDRLIVSDGLLKMRIIEKFVETS